MNKSVLIGRIASEIELKFLPGDGKAVANFTLAVQRNFKNKDGQYDADFIKIIVFGKQGENVANYVTKGKLIGVSGRIQTRSYDAKDGSKRYVTEVISDEVQFLEWANSPSNNPNENNNSFEDEFMSPIEDTGEIPF